MDNKYYTFLENPFPNADFDEDAVNSFVDGFLEDEGFVGTGIFSSGKASYFNVVKSAIPDITTLEIITSSNADEEILTDVQGYPEEMTLDEFARLLRDEFPELDYSKYILSLIEYKS